MSTRTVQESGAGKIGEGEMVS